MAHKDRLEKNAQSKEHAVNDRQPWSNEELQWLQSWDGTPEYLEELAELLGRTIEACREMFYKSRRTTKVVETETHTRTRTTTYRGWTEADGDGWN